MLKEKIHHDSEQILILRMVNGTLVQIAKFYISSHGCALGKNVAEDFREMEHK